MSTSPSSYFFSAASPAKSGSVELRMSGGRVEEAAAHPEFDPFQSFVQRSLAGQTNDFESSTIQLHFPEDYGLCDEPDFDLSSEATTASAPPSRSPSEGTLDLPLSARAEQPDAHSERLDCEFSLADRNREEELEHQWQAPPRSPEGWSDVVAGRHGTVVEAEMSMRVAVPFPSSALPSPTSLKSPLSPVGHSHQQQDMEIHRVASPNHSQKQQSASSFSLEVDPKQSQSLALDVTSTVRSVNLSRSTSSTNLSAAGASRATTFRRCSDASLVPPPLAVFAPAPKSPYSAPNRRAPAVRTELTPLSPPIRQSSQCSLFKELIY